MDLIPSSRIDSIVSSRDGALRKMREAADLLARGYALAAEAEADARGATGGRMFHLVDRTKSAHYRSLFADFDAEAAFACYRHHVDASTWTHLVEVSGIAALMDRTAKEHLDRDLAGDVPEVTVQAVRDTLGALIGDAKLIFQRGLARCFADLDKRFKSHDAFRLGSRIILRHCFDQWGCFHYSTGMVETLNDVERTFAVLDGQEPTPGALVSRIRETRRGGFTPHQSYVETPYFRVRCFKNGHAHLWFTRDDLVDKANGVLADYYGEVLPDAVPKGSDLRTTTAALSRDLAFYPSPPAVVRALLDGLPYAGLFLEPSAGDGAIVRGLLERNDLDLRRGSATVHIRAVEVDPGRLQQIPRDRRVETRAANFLALPPSGDYDAVVMNPPFEGTHWMQHVVHAFDFLRPGGVLRAVLPASAEVGTSAKHEEFRAWAVAMNEGREWGLFRDLPPESFAASGTRVQTVIFTLSKPR